LLLYSSYLPLGVPNGLVIYQASSASSCFLLFLCFRKVTQEIFSELDETKAKPPNFPDTKSETKQRWRRARGWPHHRVAWVNPWPLHQVVWATGPPSDIALPPIYSLRGENPKSFGLHPLKVPQHRPHRRPISGDISLCSDTLPGWGIALEPSPSTPPPSSSPLLTPMMRRE
jgi:hypothetical protein